MNLHLTIKHLVFCLLVLLSYGLSAQTDDNKSSIKNNDTITNSKQRYIAYSLGYHNPIVSGDNFIGNGLEGNGGLSFKLQIYIYKQFFIGGSMGSSFFNTKNPAIVGAYNKTRIAEQFAFLGYEYVATNDFRIGVTASVVGNSRYKNTFTNGARQNDSAKLRSYGAYLTYEVSNEFMFYIDYAYRIDKTNIDVPLALENTFRRGTFHQIGIGVKFSFKGKDFISLF